MHRSRGFSLIETLVSITLIVVFLMLLLSFVVFCKRIAAGVQWYADRLGTIRITADIIKANLSRAISLDSPCFGHQYFIGDAMKISFTGPIDLGDSREIYCQVWYFDPSQKRLLVSLLNPITGREISVPQDVISGVDSLEFRYCPSASSNSTETCSFFWGENYRLPRFVLIKISLSGPVQMPEMLIEIESNNAIDL